MIAGLTLAQKLIGGAAGLLLLALALFAAAKAGEARHWHKVADRNAADLAAAGAALTAQNKAVAAMKAEADAKAKAAAAALARARKQGDTLRGQADQLDRPRQPTGNCATGADVMGVKL